jgi:hypothetical protein
VVRKFLLCYAGMAPTPRAMINSFGAYLQIDLADPVLRRHLVASGRTNERLIGGLLEEAVAVGTLRPVDTRSLARVLLSLVSGSLLAWATYREGKAAKWLARDIDQVLELAGG